MLQYAVFNFKIKNKGKIATHDKDAREGAITYYRQDVLAPLKNVNL